MIKFSLAALLVMGAAPMAVSAQAAADPDKNVTGGITVAGWVGRTDRATQQITNAKFFEMAGALHVTSGPPAIYWNPKNQATGTYAVKATFTQVKAPTHPEAYGLFIGGSNLADENQNYMYCLVRGDGKFMVKHRAGSEVHTLADWTDNAALKKQDAAGKATNEISVWSSKDKLGCSVNGTEVFSVARADAVGGSGKLSESGSIYGIRVNHNLDVHISGFGMTKI